MSKYTFKRKLKAHFVERTSYILNIMYLLYHVVLLFLDIIFLILLLLYVHHLSYWRRHLVNAYKVEARTV